MIYLLLVMHWLADFVFQTSWQAQNKSKSLWALTSHIISYMSTMLLVLDTYLLVGYFFGFPTFTLPAITYYVLVNGAIHFVVDYFTSKGTAYLWKHLRVHDFFVVIGGDQVVHYFCLIYTLPILIG